MPAPTSHVQWSIRALTVPGPDTDLSLFVSFDNVRYLFGCGEGTQRAFVQKRLSMRGLVGVFLPDGGSKGRAGLPGVIMTASDAGIKKLDVIGPPDTMQYVGTLRASVYRQTMGINTIAYSSPSSSSADSAEEDGNVYGGTGLTVRSIALRPQTDNGPTGHVNAESGPSRLSPTETANLARRHVRNMFPNGASYSPRPDLQSLQPVPTYEETATQMVYICQAPNVPGKFDAEKAKSLRVPNGKQRAELVRGQPIEFDDPDNPGQKKVVRPEEVIGPSTKGAYFALVSCTTETLPDLLRSTAFASFQSKGEESSNETITVIVHRCSTAVWQDEKYRSWMRSFGENTQHLVAVTDEYRNDAVFDSSAWNVLQLSLLDGDIFPLLVASTPAAPDETALPPNTQFLAPNHFRTMQPLKELTMLGRNERDIAYPTTIQDAQTARRDLLKTLPDFAVECQKAREAVRSDPKWNKPTQEVGDDITVTTLGTGSAIPSKYRNVSSTLLDIPNLGGILLDCGEGTLGQLRRKYGAGGIKKMYEELRMIFVSHMHADHHLGLQAILEDRFKCGVESKLYLVAPLAVAVSLSEAGPWSHGFSSEALDNLIWIDNAALLCSPLPQIWPRQSDKEWEAQQSPSPDFAEQLVDDEAYKNGSRRWPKHHDLSRGMVPSRDFVKTLQRDLGLSGIRTPRVNHRGQAWGLVLHHQSGWKIVYSGDTKPCGNLVHAGRGATLLIHEATLEDDKPDVAADKGHSTFSQAIDIGRSIGAKHILLNHFSQRYPKLPKSKVTSVHAGGEADGERSVVSISYDFMSVKIGQMWRMGYYMDAAELLFNKDEGDEEDEVVVRSTEGTIVDEKSQKKVDKGKKGLTKGAGCGTKANGEKRGASPNGKAGRDERKKSRSQEGEDV